MIVVDGKERREYDKIRRLPHTLNLDREEKVVIVLNTDSFDLWAVSPGGFSSLISFYEKEAPWAITNGRLRSLITYL